MAPITGFGRGGVILIIMTFAALTCLADISDNNATDNYNNSTYVGDKTEDEEGDWFSAVKPYLCVAAVVTAVVIISCGVIKMRSQYAGGDNIPLPIVPLSHNV